MESDREDQKCENECRKLPQEAQTVALAGLDREGSLQEQMPKVFTIPISRCDTYIAAHGASIGGKEHNLCLRDLDKVISHKRSVPISPYAYSTMCISESSAYNVVAES
jgi:hypothetical protein